MECPPDFPGIADIDGTVSYDTAKRRPIAVTLAPESWSRTPAAALACSDACKASIQS